MGSGDSSTAVASVGINCEYSQWIARVREFFAPPPVPLPAHIAERQNRRLDACTRLIEHLAQPDGTLKLTGLHLGHLARALKLKFKHVVRALKDLAEIGVVAAYAAPAFAVLTPRGTTTGNRCGHHPERPRWFEPPPWHKNHPGIIKTAIEKIRDYYESPGAVLPLLNAVNESDRQQRSERREACVAMLAALLYYTDLVTLRVGRPQADGSLAGILMAELASLAGLARLNPDGSLCIRRAERAIADLEAAGIVTIHPICERLADATYRGLAAIRTVTAALFDVFGLGARLAKERQDATARQEKRAEKRRRRELGNIKMGLNALDHQRQAEAAPDAPAGRRGEMAPAAEVFALRDKLKGRGPPS